MPCGCIFSNKKMQRSSMDYLNNVNYKLFNNWQEFIDNNKNYRIILATTKADSYFYNFCKELLYNVSNSNKFRGW